MRSMTGFGRGEAASPRGTMSVEIKTVNSRFLDLNIKSPRELFALEDRVAAEIRRRLGRGKIDCFVRLVPNAEAAPESMVLNRPLMRSIQAVADALRADFGVEGHLELGRLLSVKDLLVPAPESVDPDKEWTPLKRALAAALEAVERMRAAEGEALAKDLTDRLDAIDRVSREIGERKEAVGKLWEERLRSRLAKLADAVELDPGRLEQEILYYAERGDVTEELVRLKSHVAQFRKAVGLKKPAGRRLEFLLQEMNREVNTIGSKSSDAPIAHLVVRMKEELEKMREQSANVE